MTNMANTFEILAGFLERFGDEVEGRSLQELDESVRGKLRDFATGKLPQSEQGELIRMLNQNPQWVAHLAQEVKALRPPE